MLAALAAEGFTETDTGRRLTRDGRTVAKAAEAFGIRFATRQGLHLMALQPKDAQRMAARETLATQRAADQAARATRRAAERAAAGHQRAEARALVTQTVEGRRLAARKLAAQRQAGAGAERVHQRETNRAAGLTMAARPMAAQPKVVHVVAVPAPARPPIDKGDQAMAGQKRPRRWNDGFFAGAKPKVLFIQSEVDEAVARFIAEPWCHQGGRGSGR